MARGLPGPEPMRLSARLLLLATCGIAATALAGSFGVAPTRVDLDRGTRSATIEVGSEDSAKLNFQVKLFEWTQDSDGKDQYVESQDLIWFPQLFTVNPQGKRIVRVGTRQATVPEREKTYRLFIEELTQPGAAQSGTQVSVVLRFGVPIFVAPAAPRRSFVIDSVEPMRGMFKVRIRSDGSQSAKFESLKIQRGDTVYAEAQGWYVLAGAARTFEIRIDPSKCPSPGPLEFVAAAEGVVLKQALAASPVLCERP